jgi:hypothetical protein
MSIGVTVYEWTNGPADGRMIGWIHS